MSNRERRHPIPAVAAIIVEDGKILLIKRAVEPSKGKWSVPGGSIEWGEPLIEALKREVREETGLEIEVDGIAGVFDLIVQEGRELPVAGCRSPVAGITYHYVIIDYFARPTGGDLAPGDDAADARWVSIEKLSDYDMTDHLLERLRQTGIG